MKGPVFSVPVGEIKPQGVYDIPPAKGVSEQKVYGRARLLVQNRKGKPKEGHPVFVREWRDRREGEREEEKAIIEDNPRGGMFNK